MKCQGWCLPAVIYAVLAAISLFLALLQDLSHLDQNDAMKVKFATFIFHVIWAVFWTWLLYWLCSTCNETWAWVVLFLPFFIGLAVLAFGTALIVAFMLGKGAEYGIKKITPEQMQDMNYEGFRRSEAEYNH